MQRTNNRALVPSPNPEITPIYSSALAQTENHYKVMVAFVKAQMKRDVDYGVIPGTKKPTLLKPGGEKLCRLFNLRPHMELLNSIVDFEKPLSGFALEGRSFRAEGRRFELSSSLLLFGFKTPAKAALGGSTISGEFESPNLRSFCHLPSAICLRSIYFHYRCSLYRGEEMVGEADGCCNSLENKYKKQQYKIFDLTNTICKIAQKRALVAAVLSSCGASEFFSQDIEEISGGAS